MKRALVASIAAAHLLAAATAHAQDIPSDEAGFTGYVADQMRRAAGDVQVGIKSSLTLSIGALQANLDRIYFYCKSNRAGCSGEIDTYVKGVAETIRNQNLPPTRGAIRLVVRTAEYLQRAQQQVAPTRLVRAKPFVGGLVLMPMLDLPRTLRGLSEKDSAALGLTTDQVYKVALANLRGAAKARIEDPKPVAHGEIGRLSGDVYNPSRLIFVEAWAGLAKAQGGVLIVAAPATDTVLYIGEDTPVALDAMRTLVKAVMSRAPTQLSSVLLRWTPKGWQVVP